MPIKKVIYRKRRMDMSINGVSSTANAYSAYADNMEVKSKSTSDSESKVNDNTKADSNKAAVYEKSSVKNMTASDRKALVQKLKADSDRHVANMKSLVEKMFLKQGQKFTEADDMWKALAKGDFTVDADTAAQAKADIADDGYWGVEQTSQRILDFAEALSGGDKDKMNDMLEAFKKGFKQATKSWGKDLPDISQKTYDSVIKKFEDYGKDDN